MIELVEIEFKNNQLKFIIKYGMQEKLRLIRSMENLINFVSLDPQNQPQIFKTLSQTDINKIIHNFQDSHEKLRKTSLLLLAALLSRNHELKQKFCTVMKIQPATGKIAFSFNLQMIEPVEIKQFLKLLQSSVSEHYGDFWYLNTSKKPYSIQYCEQNKIRNIDPLYNIVGFVIAEQNPDLESVSKTRIFLKRATNKKINQSYHERIKTSNNYLGKTKEQFNLSTKISINEEQKEQTENEKRPKTFKMLGSYVYTKTPKNSNQKEKQVDKSFKQMKYIKQSFISLYSPKTVMGKGFKGNETTRQKTSGIGFEAKNKEY